MKTQGNHRLGVLIFGVTAALASCLLALASVAPPAHAATQRGDLSISQTDDPDPLESGYLIYGLTVKHELVDGCGPGCYSSGTIRVLDTLPSSVTLVDVNYPTTTSNGSSVSCSGTSTVTCTIGNLNDGRSVDIDIVVKPTAAGAQTLTNTATVSSTDSYYNTNYPDPNTANNSSTATTQVSGSYAPPSGSYTRPPNTTLTDTPDTFSSTVSPRLSFTSNDANATFECKLDNAAFASCASPKQLFLLAEGPHTFLVRAKDASGNVDPTPAKHTWTVDSLNPKITFTEKPDAITNDRTPTWTWTVEDTNPSGYTRCYLYDDINERYLFEQYNCASPLNFEAELPDGDYYFSTSTYDKADNYDNKYSYFEVDNVAPTIVSTKPTGRLVKPSANVVVALDEEVYNSKPFVNIYKKGSNTPLAVYRYTYEDPDTYEDVGIELSPKSYLKRDTQYTVKVTTGVNDGANNLEAPYSWNFKTKR